MPWKWEAPRWSRSIRQSGLRGRGGAGFPTGIKWKGVAADSQPRAVVCNAAEGEPGTSKDRTILVRDPYRVIEGMAIAAVAIGASTAYLGIKARFTEPDRRASISPLARWQRRDCSTGSTFGSWRVPMTTCWESKPPCSR